MPCPTCEQLSAEKSKATGTKMRVYCSTLCSAKRKQPRPSDYQRLLAGCIRLAKRVEALESEVAVLRQFVAGSPPPKAKRKSKASA